MIRELSKLILIASISGLSLSPQNAQADDTVKALIGGIVGSLIVEGVKAATSEPEPETQPEQIEWNDNVQQQQIRAEPRRVAVRQSDPRVKEIQQHLQTTGFYHGAIDGISGSGTENAIKSWEIQFSQVADGRISDDELLVLRDSAEEGGDDQDGNYEVFSDEEKLQRALDEKRAEEASAFLEDAELFTRDYKGDVDFLSVADDLMILRDVKNGMWLEKYDKPYERLKEFYAKIDGFNAYHQSKNAVREKEKEAKRQELIVTIKRYQEFAEYNLKQNISDKQAIQYSKDLRDLNIPELNDLPFKEVEVISASMSAALTNAWLTEKYTKWKNDRYPVAADKDVISKAERSANEKPVKELPVSNVQDIKPEEAAKKKKPASLYDWFKQSMERPQGLPECNSKRALKDLAKTAESSAFSNIYNVKIMDLLEAKELPSNFQKINGQFVMSKYTNRKTFDTPVYVQNEKFCFARILTNFGESPIRYSYKIVNGVSDDQQTYIEYEEISEEEYSNLNNPAYLRHIERAGK